MQTVPKYNLLSVQPMMLVSFLISCLL